MKKSTFGLVVGLCLISISLAGCDPNSTLTMGGKIWAILMGEPAPKATPTPSPSAEEFSSLAAKNAKINAEILHEIFLVVFMREPKDRAEFGNWVDTLNQGASFEGVYNGLTHSADYRRLELAHSTASVEALKVFGEELARLELELSTPTQFEGATAFFSPISAPPVQAAPSKDPERNMDAPAPSPSVDIEPLVKPLANQYMKHFVTASVFTLKRVLADEALKVIAEKSAYKEKLALWYSRWAVRIGQRKVDFGIPLRNKLDEGFHFKWAVESGEDRIRWEILNRLHRVLNEANKQKQ